MEQQIRMEGGRVLLAESGISIVNESSAAGNHIVLSSDNEGAKLLEYQLAMLSHNSIPHILPIGQRIKNGLLAIHYDVGTLVTLKQYTGNGNLYEAEGLMLLESLLLGIIESKYYFLYEQNYLVNPEYIFIDANKMSVRMVYLPYVLDGATNGLLAEYVRETLVMLDRKGRLTASYMNEDKFDFPGILQHIKKQQFAEIILKKEKRGEEEKPFHLGEELPGESALALDDTVRVSGEKEKARISQGVRKLIFFLAIQTGILAILSFYSEKLPVQGDSMATYAGIALVLVAVNVLFLYNCFVDKKDCVTDTRALTGTYALEEEQSYRLLLEKMLVREKGVLKEELSLHKVDDRMTLSKQKQ